MKIKNKIVLEDIKDPSFLKSYNRKELEYLAADIRRFLIENIANTGGHLSSNLGVIELTIALHYVFDSPKDKMVFDVGHQTYSHKILTGRAKEFNTLRMFKGLSGYAKRSESEHDHFEAGHSSTSISAICGFLYADDSNENIAIIGDAALPNGLAFEGLNYLGSLKDKKAIVVLNDNKMAITKSVGSMSKLLGTLRQTKFALNLKKIIYKIMPGFIVNLYRKIGRGVKGFIQNDNIFEDMGFQYMGPVDGNDVWSVIKILKKAKDSKESSVVHIITQKGKGYAEKDENGDFHGVKPFDIETGEPLCKTSDNEHSWSEIISEGIIKLSDNKDIRVIIPAMVNGSKMHRFQGLYPDRLIDIGIAESHGATMCAAASMLGKKIFYCVYSTFIQRAYDQIIHDIARHDTNVVIGIDRAGLVGEDGDSHQGIYDIAMLYHIPNIIICMPHTPSEAYGLLEWSFKQKHPIFIRYQRGNYYCNIDNILSEKIKMEWTKVKEGKKMILISYGPRLNEYINITKEMDIMIINARFIKPLDYKMLNSIFSLNIPILVVEEVINTSCLGMHIVNYANEIKTGINLEMLNIKDRYVEHGKIDELLKMLKLDNDSILKKIKDMIN